MALSSNYAASGIISDKLIESFYNELVLEGVIFIVIVVLLLYIKNIKYILLLILLLIIRLAFLLISGGDNYEPGCHLHACPSMGGWGDGPAYDVGLYSLLISLGIVKLIFMIKSEWMKIGIGLISIAIGMYAVYFFIKWWPIGYYNKMMSDINYYSRPR